MTEGMPNDPSPRRGAEDRIKVVYILGEYRSGSTILSVLLGADPAVRSTGELLTLPGRFWEENPRPCSCHESPRVCPFWSKVYARCDGRVDLPAMQASKRRFEKYRSIPRILRARLFGSRELDGYVRRLAEFARVIAETESQRVVVDSSKSPIRGLMYSRAARHGLDVYFVHIVRDGRAVAYSRVARPLGGTFPHQEFTRSVGNFALRWCAVNVLALVFCSRPRSRYRRVRYEDIVSDPAGEMRRLGAFLGLDPEALAGPLERHEEIPVAHLIEANPLRFSATVTVRPDLGWKSQLSRTDQILFWGLAGWMALLYGYRLRG